MDGIIQSKRCYIVVVSFLVPSVLGKNTGTESRGLKIGTFTFFAAMEFP